MLNKQNNANPLRNEDVEWLKKQRTLIEHRKLTKSQMASIRAKYWRFRKKFLRSVEILTEVATLLPEKQKEQVLTAHTLLPLIDAFLAFEPDKDAKIVVNERAFQIAYLLASRGEVNGFDMIKYPYSGMLRQNLQCQRWAMMYVTRLGNLGKKGKS